MRGLCGCVQRWADALGGEVVHLPVQWIDDQPANRASKIGRKTIFPLDNILSGAIANQQSLPAQVGSRHAPYRRLGRSPSIKVANMTFD